MNSALTVLDQEASAEARVQSIALEIASLSRKAALEFALDVGRIVFSKLYEGDLTEWRSRGRKASSLRALARHPALCISPATLYRSLALYELHLRLNPVSWNQISQHVGVSHLRVLLSAPAETQTELLEKAVNGGWSVARLEREVTELSERDRHRGGRPRSPEYIKSIRRIGRLTAPEALQGLDEATKLDRGEVQELLVIVKRVRDRISLIEHELARVQRESERRAAL
jgi:hypothetical protein